MNKVVKIRFNFKKIVRNMILILFFLMLISIFVGKIYAYKDTTYKKIIVSDGDTLWSIAKQEQKYNDFYKNKDIREIIYNIKKINNLENNLLEIGQELNIETLN